MDDSTSLIEFETMLLGRHLNWHTPNPHRQTGHLDRSAYTLLGRLDVQGPMSIGELSDAFGLDASTLNRQTRTLLRDGLVERIPDPAGGVARKFRATAEGERLLSLERAANVSGVEQIVAQWEPEDVATLGALLKRFNTDIERLAGRPWPRP
ncbi:MarR family transcriptional regulator [Rhodococcus sp. D2-41]|uniref:MarR family transcriptional regulator n=1 Tax=Speluncibacter jeojiensis TaxID=2710754 RepID=A0A9X4M4Q2_9ACTN|nr:MarR family transcriptional regulator [Rhodococcus sp. D2-41]MDG3009669.1 MarR family transcriptional regulator [Rhodococcus sp. D2-41]MDG3014416.1 MarR family transcriptional regulator [Corynebacteriales bacterium D3-21]